MSSEVVDCLPARYTFTCRDPPCGVISLASEIGMLCAANSFYDGRELIIEDSI